jgi:hypothetical protein
MVQLSTELCGFVSVELLVYFVESWLLKIAANLFACQYVRILWV